MLWRFSFASASNVDAILSREIPPSVEELMDEQEILNECKAQNNKLITYLAREDSVKSLLQWVISGLDELDQQAALADSACFDHVIASPALYPSYQLHAGQNTGSHVPGPGPNSPPLEPAKIAEEEADKEDESGHGFPQNVSDIGLGEGLERQQSRDEATRSRYPQIATEILTSELWTVSETILSNKEALLTPFWDAVLPPIEPTTPSTDDSLSRSRIEQSERARARDEFWSEKDEERDRKREVIRGMWTRVNGALMTNRTHDMIRFIQSLPDIIDRIMAHITSPAVQDMLIRIVSAEEAGVKGVIAWLAEEGLIPRLLELLSPEHSTSTHSVASELLKSVITLCAPTPFNPNGGNAAGQPGQAQPSGTRDNRMIRELVSESSINTMISYMLDPIDVTDADWQGINGPDGLPHPADPFVVHPLPSIASASSSLSHICNILVEIIRRNNSDFSEPHLFHTLRNRLMIIQGQEGPQPTDVDLDERVRKEMEEALADLSGKMGIVHLGHLIATLSDRFAELHNLLIKPKFPRKAEREGYPAPLTLERFRVVELYAELLHSSNMSILNRATGTGPSYTDDGILQGGLGGLEALGEAVEAERNEEEEEGGVVTEDQVTQARELPVSSGSTDCSLTASDEVESVDEEMLEHIDDDATPSPSPAASRTLDPPSHPEAPEPPPASLADDKRLRDVRDMEPPAVSLSAASDMGSVSHAAVAATTVAPSIASEPTDTASVMAPRDEALPAGDRLKQMYIQHRVLPDVVDLFFDFPCNDFMHHVVYDLLQQILNGRLGPGLNRELVIELLREARLIERILDAQRLNDKLITKKKQPRLPYMGHIVLIAEELVKFLARCPPDLYDLISSSFVPSEWEAFVEGSLSETKAKDARPLAGGRPMGAMAAAAEAIAKEEESSSDSDEEPADGHKFGEPLTRIAAQDGFANRRSFEADDRDDDDEFWASHSASRRHVDSSDEDDDDADWLRPSAMNMHGGSDDEDFGDYQNTGPSRLAGSGDDFDDDGWGTFNSSSNDDADNPFGDDNFAPSVQLAHQDASARVNNPYPLTPHDWASEFDREFEDALPAIMVPNVQDDDEEEEGAQPGFSGSPAGGWAFSGNEDQAEDLPPTTSPTVEQVPELGETLSPTIKTAQDVDALVHQTAAMDLRDAPPDALSGNEAGERTPASPMTVPRRASAPQADVPVSPVAEPARSAGGASSPLAIPGRRLSSHDSDSAFSPPEASLINASTEEEPLGPGVKPDTHVTPLGMLEREVNGHKVVVPADEVVRGVEEAMESGSPEQVERLERIKSID